MLRSWVGVTLLAGLFAPKTVSLTTNLQQWSGATQLNVGDTSTANSIELKGDVNFGPPCNSAKIEVEAKFVGTAFTGSGTVISPIWVAPTGSQAIATVTGLADGQYHWQVRGLGD